MHELDKTILPLLTVHALKILANSCVLDISLAKTYLKYSPRIRSVDGIGATLAETASDDRRRGGVSAVEKVSACCALGGVTIASIASLVVAARIILRGKRSK